MKKNCYNCAYKNIIPGSAHFKCVFNWKKSNKTSPKANEHGIKKGWYIFPFNFDPVWQEEPCQAYSKIEDPNMIYEFNSFEDILSIFGRHLTPDR